VEELKDGWIRSQKKPADPVLENAQMGLPPKKEKVKLVSYTIKMVIPLERYANIQPEITVKGGTLEEAHAYCAPHMNKLWKEYYMITERRAEPAAPTNPNSTSAPTPVPTPPVTTAGSMMTGTPATWETKVTPPPPASSVALTKATQAIQSCLSLEALDLIANQVQVSVKLTNEDKTALMPLLDAKFKELSK